MASFEWPPRGGSGGGGGGGSGSLVKATLYDPVDTTLPAGASAVIDGVTLTNGMTVLFSALLAGNNEIYTVSGVGTALVWTPLAAFGSTPSITPTAGDQVIFTQGTGFADQVATFNGTTWSVNNFVRYFNGVDYWEQSSLQNATLAANTTNDVFNIAFLGSENMIVSYSLLRGAVKEVGQIFITTDGVTANVSVQSDYIGASGVTFFADIVGPNIRLRFTTDNSGGSTTMKYFLARWSDASGGPGGVPSYSSGSITSWLLGGNAGTTAGTNFLGTTDAEDLVFKTSGTERMRIIDATGEVHIPGKLTVDGILDPTQVLLTGADKKFGATDAGAIYLAPFADQAGAVQIRLADNTTPVLSIDTNTPKVTIDGVFALTGSTNNSFTGFDSSGNLESIPGFAIDTTSGGMNIVLTENPNNNGGFTINPESYNFEPLQNSPNESWNIHSTQIFLDPTSTGFTFGTAGYCSTIHNNGFTHLGTGNTGGVNFISNSLNLGNGTDPISVNGISYSFGFGAINAGVTITGQVQGYGFQPNFNASSFLTNSVNAFYDFATLPISVPGYNSFIANPTIGTITNNNNYVAYNTAPNITTLSGNAGYFGLAISPTVTNINTGGFFGISINPTLTTALAAQTSDGININMDNVAVFAGTFSSLVFQDLTLTFNAVGDNNTFSLEYTPGGTAGAEVVSIVGNAISVQIDSGVSTATQIRTALLAQINISTNISVTVSGVGANPQVTAGPTSFAGGSNPGTKRAAFFKGNVQIDGDLGFTGSLSIGRLNSFAPYTIVSGSGGVASIDTLITSITLAASATVTNADTIGVNTAALITIGANASVSTGFIGLAALGLPAVLEMATGSTIDNLSAAVFALSLSGSATGGTVDNVYLCRAIPIANGGVTTINHLYGFEMDAPAGDPGTQTWGVYIKPAVNNWLAGMLKIGGTAGSTDVVTGGYLLDVQGSALIQTSLDLQDPGVGTFKIVIQAPTLAADWTFTLPPDNGTPGQVLSTDGSGITTWIANTATAAGAPTEIQYNTGGALDADSDFTWDATNNILTLGALQYVGLSAPLTLLDNTTAVTITYNQASFRYAIIEYGIDRGVDGFQVGRLMVVNDGTLVTITDDANSTLVTVGVTFTAALNAGNVEISYTTTSTGNDASFTFSMRRWG